MGQVNWGIYPSLGSDRVTRFRASSCSRQCQGSLRSSSSCREEDEVVAPTDGTQSRSVCRNSSTSKAEFRVLILGIEKAGKTTLLEKVKSLYSDAEGLPPDRIVPTVGLNIGRVEGSEAKLVFWDLGGQIGLRTIWEKYYDEAHAIIYVIDAACPSSFEDSKLALAKVLRHEDLRGAPVLILANKQDLPGAASAEELTRYLDLKELDDRLYMYEAVSAYNGTGIKIAIDWLMKVMERSKRTDMLRMRVGAGAQVLE